MGNHPHKSDQIKRRRKMHKCLIYTRLDCTMILLPVVINLQDKSCFPRAAASFKSHQAIGEQILPYFRYKKPIFVFNFKIRRLKNLCKYSNKVSSVGLEVIFIMVATYNYRVFMISLLLHIENEPIFS